MHVFRSEGWLNHEAALRTATAEKPWRCGSTGSAGRLPHRSSPSLVVQLASGASSPVMQSMMLVLLLIDTPKFDTSNAL